MQYVVTAAFLLAIVATSFAAVILGGYGIARLIAPPCSGSLQQSVRTSELVHRGAFGSPLL
jgi:hypothetical protein